MLHSHLSVKRNTKSLSCDASVSLQQKRQVVMRYTHICMTRHVVTYTLYFLRLRAVSLGQHSEITFREDTGLLRLTLAQDEVSVRRRCNLLLYVMYVHNVMIV